MSRIFKIGFLLITCLHLFNCNGQTPTKHTDVLSNDFDKSIPFYYRIPKNLSSIDTSPGFQLEGQKILLTGTLYQRDGKTPASYAILYYYQTNPNGIYETKESEESFFIYGMTNSTI